MTLSFCRERNNKIFILIVSLAATLALFSRRAQSARRTPSSTEETKKASFLFVPAPSSHHTRIFRSGSSSTSSRIVTSIAGRTRKGGTRRAAPSSASASSSPSFFGSSTAGGDGKMMKMTMNTAERKKFFNFQRGHPNYVPTDEMNEIMRLVADSSSSTTISKESAENDDCGGAGAAMRDLMSKSLTYLSSDPGQPELLHQLSDFLERHCAGDDLGDDGGSAGDGDGGQGGSGGSNNGLFMTNGVSHGLDLLCATQTQPGDVVLVERPTYFLAFGIFKSHRLAVEGLPMKAVAAVSAEDDDNIFGGGRPLEIDVNALERRLGDGSQPRPRMIYIIPTHQNPTGGNMSVETKRKLAELSSRYGVLIAADEVYHLLDWRDGGDRPGKATRTRRPARMALFNDLPRSRGCATPPPMCVSVSSFTKIFAPGIRCGWVEGPESVIEGLTSHGYIRSGGACAPFTGALMTAAFRHGIVDRVLSDLTSSYERKCRLLCAALAEAAAEATGEANNDLVRFNEPCGGYFLWIELPVNSQDFLEYCRDEKGVLQFLPGHQCDCPATDNTNNRDEAESKNKEETESASPAVIDFSRSARLCFAYMDDDDLVEGAQLLVLYLLEYMEMNDLRLATLETRKS